MKFLIRSIIVSSIVCAIVCDASANNSNYALRPISFLEKQNTAAIPYTTDVSKFKGSVLRWLRENALYERYGRWQLLREEKGAVRIKLTLHGVDYDREEIATDIVPRERRATMPYGGYEEGIECFEGAWPLYNTLKSAGYEVKLAECAIALAKHVYVKVKIENRWVRVSTTPDVETFDFEIAGHETELSEVKAGEDFDSYAEGIPFDQEGLIPMTMFTSSEGKKLAIAAHIVHTSSEAVTIDIGGYDLEESAPRIYKFSVGVERRRILAFREWVRGIPSDQRGQIFRTISAEKAQGDLQFVNLRVPDAGSGRFSQELEETCSHILYDIIANLTLEVPEHTATSFSQLETIPAPLASGLSAGAVARLAGSSI